MSKLCTQIVLTLQASVNMVSSLAFMPKRTRKEKIRADHRRALEFVKPPDALVASTVSLQTTPGFVFRKDTAPTSKTITVTHDFSYVGHDLIRITIFTLAALIVQGVLYFVVRR